MTFVTLMKTMEDDSASLIAELNAYEDSNDTSAHDAVLCHRQDNSFKTCGKDMIQQVFLHFSRRMEESFISELRDQESSWISIDHTFRIR
jgi:hypothetical protein